MNFNYTSLNCTIQGLNCPRLKVFKAEKKKKEDSALWATAQNDIRHLGEFKVKFEMALEYGSVG
jgi:outer membrane biogenesis lipoprotein LolB